MASRIAYKTTFEAQQVIQPIYTGGSIALDTKGQILATTLGDDALLTDLATGRELARIEGDGEQISTLTLTPDASFLVICSRSLSLRIYALKTSSDGSIIPELLRTLKPHTTPVIVLAVDKTSTLLATGAADGVVKVWDIRGGYATHTFRGPNILITALHFFELMAAQREQNGISARNRKKSNIDTNGDVEDVARGYRLASGTQDGKVRIWDLYTRNCASTLDSHVADVRCIDYSPDENVLMSGSRDKTVMLWDVKTWKIRKVVPVFEEVETCGFVAAGSMAYTGGANGTLRVWQIDNGREITRPQQSGGETDAILNSVYCPAIGSIITTRVDHVITLHSTASLSIVADSMGELISPLQQIRRISGTHEEIIDLAYLTQEQSLLALATNSEELRIVTLNTHAGSTYFGADVAQLYGHGDIIICLDVDWSGHWIATGAKDNTARLWRIDPVNNSYTCYATFEGHAESLGAIALPRTIPADTSAAFKSPLDHPPAYLLTGSQDRTVKRWSVSKTTSNASRAMYTRKAHDKDINALDINYFNNLFASASQDRTVKIWSLEEGETIGVLRGHRRGVWSVKFAPRDTPIMTGDSGPAAGKGLVVTGSGDKTMKIWNLSDYSCIRTFEGHTNNVLKVAWLNISEEERGRRHVQIATAGADGLVKVWDGNSGECVATLDNHEDRVWALAVHPKDNTIVSGSADSTVTFWADTSSATQAASVQAATQFVEQEQELQNYIHAGSYRDAITLALQLNHPARLLTLFTSVVTSRSQEGLTGSLAVDEVLANLSDEQLFTLLLRIRDWNTNARTAHIAQRILWAVVKSYPATRLSGLKTGPKGQKSMRGVLDALKAYTERHYRRMEELVDESYLVEYTLREMDVTLGLEQIEDAMEV